MILLVDCILQRDWATHIWSHTASYYRSVRCYVLLFTLRPWPYLWWLQSQRRGGLTGICIAAVSLRGAHSMKRPAFGAIRIQSLHSEVFVDPWFAPVEMVSKMIMKSGKSWEYILSYKSQWNKWQSTCMFNWSFILLHMAASCRWFQWSCDLQSVSAMLFICLFAGIHWSEWQLISHVC